MSYNYSDIIGFVSSQVRDKIAWPNDTSKLQDQINEIYSAMIEVAKRVPIHEIHQTDTTTALTASGTPILAADMPDDLFDGRRDYGIKYIELDTELKLPEESVSLPTLRMASSNTYQAQNVLFTITKDRFYFINATTANITYSPLPTKPTTSNYSTTTFPLMGNNVDAVVAEVASHITSVQVRDPQGGAIHANFAQHYKGE